MPFSRLLRPQPGIDLDRRRKRWLDAGFALALAAIVAFVGAMTWLARERELAASRAQLANLAVALERYVYGTVSAVDSAMATADYALRLLPQYPRAALADGNRVLADAAAQIGLPIALRLLDADGRLVHSSDGRPFAGNARDREYFQFHRDRTDAGLYVSELLRSRVSGVESLVFSRRVDGADGRFAGVVVAEVPVTVLERDFGRFRLAAGDSVALGDDAGRLYARRPSRPELVGKVVINDTAAVLRLLEEPANGGVITRRSSDGSMRMNALRRVGTTRLVVSVASPVADQLAPWRLQAALVGGVVLVFGAGSLILFMLLTRDLVRKTQLADELRQALAALQQSVRDERSANEAKTAFLSSISHELMTPLNGIYGAVQLWQLGEQDATRRRLAEVAKTSTERLNTALRDALAYASAASQPEEGKLTAFDLRDLLPELPELFAVQRGSGACRLEPPAVPDRPLAVRTDPAALRDALRRLLGIAVRVAGRRPTATAEDAAAAPGAIRVGVDATPEGARLAFDVAVDPATCATLAVVLKPFADAGATEISGLHDVGLSLEVARLLATRAGATLLVECRDGRFAMTLALRA